MEMILSELDYVKQNRWPWIKMTELETKIIQLQDAKMDYFIEFYEQQKFLEKYNTAFIVYDGDSYFSIVSYYEIRDFSIQEELDYYFQYECFHGWKNCIDEEVQEIFEKHPRIRLIPAEKPGKNLHNCKFICEYPVSDKIDRCRDILALRDTLRMKGIKTYYAKVPSEGEVVQHPDFFYCFSDAFLWTERLREKVIEILPYMTSKTYEESKGWMKRKKWIESTGNGARKIYLVGPCIVNGDEVFTEDEIATLLSEALEKEGLTYEVIKICRPWFQYDFFCEEILECEIHKNEMVVFLDEAVEGYDLDLTELFKNYSGNDWLYSDVPIHTTRRGNERIVSSLMEKIFLPGYNESCPQDDGIVLQYGKKQLSSREKAGIEGYLTEIDHLITRRSAKEKIAAIVMTCNPFTYGHQYLAEWGSRNSDLLYIFVVEEDAFVFPFRERIELIKAGTKHLDNVTVLPGGKFLATKATFRNYYEREKTDDRKVDASKDIFFFSEYIAPYLHITKRFVGEEPIDKVTAQYNRQLKDNLPEYGIEVHEIPRKKYGGQVISASFVRKCIEEGVYDKLPYLVPDSTNLYIKYHIEELRKRGKIKRDIQISDTGRKILEKMKAFIEKKEKVVLYGTGGNAQKLTELLGEQCTEKAIFCDGRAEKEELYFHGKKVIAPDELYRNYRDAGVLITSHVYRRDIFLELRKNGIPKENVLCAENWVNLVQ